ncbi:inhibitor of apoptosis-promoting Bax1-domain-containing protein [Scenedesmus sp. NREL 46B-D3]|nr:inhibitor of apoptosis-promoting Bax1-domain-containing protein [Scenedesmus sp. NREL 46B-D3]
MSPYTGVVHGASYSGSFGVPLLSGAAGFVEDVMFANRQVRHAFLCKVLVLVTLQLLATAAIASPIHAHKPARKFLRANPWGCGLAAIAAFTVLLVAAWSEGARRRQPTNQLLLALFTAASGLLVGVASATYSTPVPLLGLLLSASVSLALVAYASQASRDFSASGGILYSALVVLLVVSLATWFLGFKTLHLLIAGCGALVFSAYLVCDVQLLVSGDSGYQQVTPDEYVFAVINVYTDVISSFMYVLQVLTQLQSSSDDD